MSIFDFKKRFGQEINVNELKQDFINKINHFLIEPLDDSISFYYNSGENNIFDFVAIAFNANPSEIIREHNRGHYSDSLRRPALTYFSDKTFEGTMLLVEVLHDYYKNGTAYNRSDVLDRIYKVVDLAMNQPLSIGITWREGRFYPEGVEEFDEKLISDVLKWLDKRPKIQMLYKNALDYYSQSVSDSIKRKDVVSNSFQAVEQLTREFLESPKGSFDNNFNELVGKLAIDNEWKKIFYSYKELSKEFGRHAGKSDDFIPSREDTEAFLYLSGLIMRLILQK